MNRHQLRDLTSTGKPLTEEDTYDLIASLGAALSQIDVLQTSMQQESQRYRMAHEYARRQPQSEAFGPEQFAMWYAADNPGSGGIVDRWCVWVSVIHAYRSVPVSPTPAVV